MVKTKIFPLRSRTRQECPHVPFSPVLFNIILEVFSQCNKARKEINATQIGKEEIKLSLFSDNMLIIYVENPEEFTKNKQKSSWNKGL